MTAKPCANAKLRTGQIVVRGPLRVSVGPIDMSLATWIAIAGKNWPAGHFLDYVPEKTPRGIRKKAGGGRIK